MGHVCQASLPALRPYSLIRRAIPTAWRSPTLELIPAAGNEDFGDSGGDAFADMGQRIEPRDALGVEDLAQRPRQAGDRIRRLAICAGTIRVRALGFEQSRDLAQLVGDLLVFAHVRDR